MAHGPWSMVHVPFETGPLSNISVPPCTIFESLTPGRV
jgi:hypothetical protein